MAALPLSSIRIRRRQADQRAQNIITGMGRIFSLTQARELLPQVKLLTADAVIRAEAITAELRQLPEADPAHSDLTGVLREIIDSWTEAVRALGLEAKGLWLVDFDNGEGYYCWSYPEPIISHFHGYEDGFAGRIRIQ